MADYIVHKAIEVDKLSPKAIKAMDCNDWIISPKYDGCHVVFCYEGGRHIATYSRTGETVHSMQHIAQDLLAVYPDVGTAERIAICGEAWMLGEDFNVISGTFRRQYPQPQLQFVPFDCVPFDWNEASNSTLPVLLGQFNHRMYPAPYSARLSALLNRRSVPSQVLVPRFIRAQGDYAHVHQLAEQEAAREKCRTDAAFDGVVMAQATGKYIVGAGRGGEFLKCKPLISYSVKVTAVVSDIGGKTGKNTCVLMFDLHDKIQKVSTGLTQAQADEYTANPERIIDSTIEVEAMGITVNGFLREPRFKGIRIDA